jgi:pimeloyl-ACP methyl ester carboxylesterase
MDLPLILLPGLLCDDRLWQAAVRDLAVKVSVADLTRDDGLAAMADRLLAHAPPRFALAGLSMGGYLAMEILRRAPERVARLALLDTTPHADRPEQTERRRDAIALVRAGRFETVVATLPPSLLGPMAQADPRLAGLVRDMARAIGPDAFIRQQKAIMGRRESWDLLPLITCPTLVLCGACDGLTPPDLHRAIAAAIPGSRLAVVPEAGHLSPLERPGPVGAALAGWLGEGA